MPKPESAIDLCKLNTTSARFRANIWAVTDLISTHVVALVDLTPGYPDIVILPTLELVFSSSSLFVLLSSYLGTLHSFVISSIRLSHTIPDSSSLVSYYCCLVVS